VKFFWLNCHVNYACRDSGMCCTSGWPIPVERPRVPMIEEAIARDVIPLRVVPWLTPDAEAPDDVAGILGLRDNGHCVFFEAGKPGCAIHAIKPAACVHFPHVCLIDQRGVRVNLSHFCPTAAAMLFEARDPIAIVEGPSPIAEGGVLEGLDARESLPPAAEMTAGTPGETPRLMTFDQFSDWEREQIVNARMLEWQDDDLEWFDRARATVPLPWTWQGAPQGASGIWWSAAAPHWHWFEDALNRYAAAKVFGAWSAYMGDGLNAVRNSARMAAAVLRVETARQCAIFGRPLDRELMIEAIRQSDLLLVHYADPALLATTSSAAR
jgi:Fe-S-cluster containining protein